MLQYLILLLELFHNLIPRNGILLVIWIVLIIIKLTMFCVIIWNLAILILCLFVHICSAMLLFIIKVRQLLLSVTDRLLQLYLWTGQHQNSKQKYLNYTITINKNLSHLLSYSYSFLTLLKIRKYCNGNSLFILEEWRFIINILKM